jgi:hypothetical protein
VGFGACSKRWSFPITQIIALSLFLQVQSQCQPYNPLASKLKKAFELSLFLASTSATYHSLHKNYVIWIFVDGETGVEKLYLEQLKKFGARLKYEAPHYE